ncbi:hypothetical protein POP12_149 [Pectobacterium phage POP12]|nr:hypothetical protein POP12_149 [Pectobacterium phage POP12]
MITNLEFKQAVATPTPTNHIFVCDVSGSMYNELPKIRNHLKNNLASLVKAKDTVSILYFSSRGQYGSVFVGQEVKSLSDLSEINAGIDRWLRPTGCTGFVEPLQLAAKIGEELQAENGNLNSLLFLTDGYDNCWSQQDILKACTVLPLTFNNIAFMEYGYYVNRPLLEKMAEATNALHKFVEGFDQYEPAFDEIISAQTSKRIEVQVGDATHVVFIDDGIIRTVNAANGVALIPEHIQSAWSIGADVFTDIDKVTANEHEQLYVVLYHAVNQMNSDLAWKVLQKLGDVRLIKTYDNCFTKQDYSNAKDVISEAVVNPEKRFVDGIDYNMVPDENAYTLLQALQELTESDAVVDLQSEYFSYNRTGRKTVQKEDTTIADLSEQISNATTAEERKELAAKLVSHEEWTPKFTQTTTKVLLKHMVTNGSRPNISINTDLFGYITIPQNIQEKYGLPATIDTKQVRNYTVVKDGIVNMKMLPLETSIETLKKLRAAGLVIKPLERIGDDKMSVVVDFTSLPLVNRAMTKGFTGAEFVEAAVDLQVLKARQKVMKYHRDNVIGLRNAVAFEKIYGEEAANFLSENGIRDYGFSPKTERTESTDVYMSKELNVKIKTLSSLPAVEATIAKKASGKKINAADHIMLMAIDEFKSLVETMPKDKIADFLEKETKRVINQVRELERTISTIMYGVVVGHGWFSDIDFDNPVMVIKKHGFEFNCSVVLEEKEQKI